MFPNNQHQQPHDYNPRSPLPVKYFKSPRGFDPPIMNNNYGEIPENNSYFLIRCQNTIQDLQIELDKTNKDKAYLQEKLENTQKSLLEFETKCSQEKFVKEKLQEEIQTLKTENFDAKQNIFIFEEKMRTFREKERLYEEVKLKFEEVCSENEVLESNIESLQKELGKKEQLEKEWDMLLGSVKSKIKLLQQENDGLRQDNRSLSQTVENMKIIANEKESIRKILQGKETDIEKKTREIGQLTQDLEQRTHELESIHRKFLEAQEITNERIETSQKELESQLMDQQKILTDQFTREFDQYKAKTQKELQEKQEYIEANEMKILKLTTEKQELMAEIKRISEQNEISIRELRVENKRKLQEKEEYFNDELKKNALVMKDQNELIQSFEEKIEKSLQHQKKIEEKYLSQLNQAKEEKRYMEAKIFDIQARYNNICRSIENECLVDEEDYKGGKIEEEEPMMDSERYREIPPNEEEENYEDNLKDYNPAPMKHIDRSYKKNDDSRVSSSSRKYQYSAKIAPKQEKPREKSEEKSQKKYSDSKYRPLLENKTKRYHEERSPHDLSRTKMNLNEEKFSSTKKKYESQKPTSQEESKLPIKPKSKYLNYKYSNEKPKLEIQESSTPNKNYDLLQRNKIKSMYESQSTTHSSNSREFLSKFKKVVGRLEDQLDKISTEIKINNITSKSSKKE